MSNPILQIRNLKKVFGSHQVLKDINISVNKGEIITKQNIEYIMNLADDGNITAANQLKNMQCIATAK